MQKETVTLSVLLTISVTILGLGVNLLQQGEYATGVACIVVGFGVMLVGVYLFEKGIIQSLTGGRLFKCLCCPSVEESVKEA